MKQFSCSWCGRYFRIKISDGIPVYVCQFCKKKNKIWRGIRAIKWYDKPPNLGNAWRTEVDPN